MKQKIFILVLSLVAAVTATAQNEKLAVKKIETKDFPQGVEIKGNVKESFTWTDNSGNHLLVLCEKVTKHSDDNINAELFAFHYLVKNGVAEQTWRTYDFTEVCPVDFKADFIPDAACVTDLDGNGESEVWLIYLLGCKGDVSPWNMKIIMHEGTQKYAMRGQQRAAVDRDEHGNFIFYGGDYKYDSAFTNAPKEIRDFGLKLWEQYKDDENVKNLK